MILYPSLREIKPRLRLQQPAHSRHPSKPQREWRRGQYSRAPDTPCCSHGCGSTSIAPRTAPHSRPFHAVHPAESVAVIVLVGLGSQEAEPTAGLRNTPMTNLSTCSPVSCCWSARGEPSFDCRGLAGGYCAEAGHGIRMQEGHREWINGAATLPLGVRVMI